MFLWELFLLKEDIFMCRRKELIYKIVKIVENVACILWKIDIEKKKTDETPTIGELTSAFFLVNRKFPYFQQLY